MLNSEDDIIGWKIRRVFKSIGYGLMDIVMLGRIAIGV